MHSPRSYAIAIWKERIVYLLVDVQRCRSWRFRFVSFWRLHLKTRACATSPWNWSFGKTSFRCVCSYLAVLCCYDCVLLFVRVSVLKPYKQSVAIENHFIKWKARKCFWSAPNVVVTYSGRNETKRKQDNERTKGESSYWNELKKNQRWTKNNEKWSSWLSFLREQRIYSTDNVQKSICNRSEGKRRKGYNGMATRKKR